MTFFSACGRAGALLLEALLPGFAVGRGADLALCLGAGGRGFPAGPHQPFGPAAAPQPHLHGLAGVAVHHQGAGDGLPAVLAQVAIQSVVVTVAVEIGAVVVGEAAEGGPLMVVHLRPEGNRGLEHLPEFLVAVEGVQRVGLLLGDHVPQVDGGAVLVEGAAPADRDRFAAGAGVGVGLQAAALVVVVELSHLRGEQPCPGSGSALEQPGIVRNDEPVGIQIALGPVLQGRRAAGAGVAAGQPRDRQPRHGGRPHPGHGDARTGRHVGIGIGGRRAGAQPRVFPGGDVRHQGQDIRDFPPAGSAPGG